MRIDIITIFPEMFEQVLKFGAIKAATEKQLLEIVVNDLRDWTEDKHRQVDDEPYGGGPGMVMKPEPLYRSLQSVLGHSPTLLSKGERTALMTPQGRKLDQGIVEDLSKADKLVLICGRYEGVDERVRGYVSDEISLGDFILSGGEMAAMVLIDAVTRLIDGVLGKKDSLLEESFNAGMLEYPQYTRPSEFMGEAIPEVLISGNHQEIKKWRFEQSRIKTWLRRPDLLRQR